MEDNGELGPLRNKGLGHLTKLWNPICWSASCGKGNPKWTVGERSYKYINYSLMIREIKVGSTLHDFSQFSFLFFLLPFLFTIDSGSDSKLCDLLQSSQYFKICLWTKLKRNEDGFDMESVNNQWLQITRHCLGELQEWLAGKIYALYQRKDWDKRLSRA